MNQPIRVGIVGCGLIAILHAQIYQKLGAKIAWVYDPSPSSLAYFAKSSELKFPFKTAGSIRELADRNKIDVASICSPAMCHPEAAVALIEAGVPTLCEKPLAGSLAGAEAIAQAVRRTSGAVFMTGYCHRFEPRVIELAKIIRSGRLGKPMLFRNMYGQFTPLEHNSNADPNLSGGGAMSGNGSHSIDLFRWLVGEPTRVQAMMGTLGQDVAVEDVGLMHLSVNEQAFGEISSSYSTHGGHYSIAYFGSEGTATVDYFDFPPSVMRYRMRGEAKWTAVECALQPDVFTAEFMAFLECARTGATPPITAEDGLAAARVLDAVYRSAREGRSVIVG